MLSIWNFDRLLVTNWTNWVEHKFFYSTKIFHIFLIPSLVSPLGFKKSCKTVPLKAVAMGWSLKKQWTLKKTTLWCPGHQKFGILPCPGHWQLVIYWCPRHRQFMIFLCPGHQTFFRPGKVMTHRHLGHRQLVIPRCPGHQQFEFLCRPGVILKH